MQRNASSLRLSMTLLLLAGLFFGAAGGAMARVEEETEAVSNPPRTSEPAQVDESVNPVPLQAADELNVFISEFRTNGPAGGFDEFIEIFNATGNVVPIGNWKIRKSSGCSISSPTTLVTIDPGIELQPGQHYLIGNSGGYSGSISLDDDYTSSISDDGGIALLDDTGNIIDQVGMCTETLYKEGTILSPLTNSVEQSYERKTATNFRNCNDTDNNVGDFVKNSTTSNPQNLASQPLPCLVVVNVTSSKPDGVYSTGEQINIRVTFSDNVNATGQPKLLIETGATDRNATFIKVDDNDPKTIIFRYVVEAGDSSADLDYVSANALSLNGGSITGAIGNAILILPKPGETGSLSVNNNIAIDTTTVNPTLLSIKRQDPLVSTTNADAITFRTTFSEAVIGVDETDFVVSGVTGGILSINQLNGAVYDITVSGGNLADLNNTVGLNLAGAPPLDITDVGGRPVDSAVLPNPNETYKIDNIDPTVTVVQATGQADPAKMSPIAFTITFSEKIDPATFIPSDVTQAAVGGPFVSWSIVDSGDHKIFTLFAYPGDNGEVAPAIPQDRVKDLAGNLNTAYTSTYTICSNPINDCVVMGDTYPPTVTIEQAVGQPDPTSALPIRFTVLFSEPINASTFTTSDITQNGIARGVSWSITNSGDDKTFTLTAISTTTIGTLEPFIAANRVLDMVGNNNEESTSTDGLVNYLRPLTVTVNQKAGQKDPTIYLPIDFTVVFSDDIDPSTFTPDDITQNGTASGITWKITKAGDKKTFTLSATDASNYGTLIPSIAANQATGVNGLGNNTSTGSDNSVSYIQSQNEFKMVVISEVAWMGTSSSYPSDEWIELFNNTTEPVDLTGWRLRSYRYNGEDFVLNLDIALTGKIQPRGSEAQGDTSGYYLLETRASAVNFPGGNDPQGQPYSGSLYNTGEILLLCSRYNIEVANNCNVNTKNQIVDYVNATLNTNGTIKPWAAGSSTIYGSMERKNLLSDEETAYFTHTGHNPRSGQDAGGNAIKGTPGHPNWAFTVTSTPRITPTLTPTRTPTPRPAAAPILVLNEILARAGSDWNNDGKVDVYDEFIEVINYGTIDLNLSSYRLDDYELDASGKVIANAFPLPSQTLKPGEKAVFYASQTGIRLDDSGDTVRLIRASNNEVVDARSYSLVKALDFSICRYRDGFVSWVEGCFPTPGLPNKLTGTLPASASNGGPFHVCVLADSVPIEFVLAECGESGLGIWNPFYWDSFPGEGGEIWQSDERDKWIVIYQ